MTPEELGILAHEYKLAVREKDCPHNWKYRDRFSFLSRVEQYYEVFKFLEASGARKVMEIGTGIGLGLELKKRSGEEFSFDLDGSDVAFEWNDDNEKEVFDYCLEKFGHKIWRCRSVSYFKRSPWSLLDPKTLKAVDNGVVYDTILMVHVPKIFNGPSDYRDNAQHPLDIVKFIRQSKAADRFTKIYAVTDPVDKMHPLQKKHWDVTKASTEAVFYRPTFTICRW